MQAQQIVRLATLHPLALINEKRVQADIAAYLSADGLAVTREVPLSGRDIVDMMVADRIAVEVKIKGQRAEIFKQMERYAEHARVQELVLLTSRFMDLPATINGKPVLVGWLSQAML